MRIASRVSELSLHGCCLDMMNPFPTGTLVPVKTAAGDAFFQAKAKIVYPQMNMGAGVSFLEVDPDSQTALERWLDEAERPSDAPLPQRCGSRKQYKQSRKISATTGIPSSR